MSNLSVLQRNIIHALDHDEAATVFLRACDKVPLLVAERHALHARLVSKAIDMMLPMAARACGLATVPAGLREFIMTRHWNTLGREEAA